MKNFKWWSWVGGAILGVALAGCGSGGDSSGTVSLRLANATLSHDSIDLIVNAASSITGTAADTISAYASPAAGSTSLQVNDTATGTSLATSLPTLTGGAHYTVLAYESGGAVKTAVLTEDTTAPSAGLAQVRIYDAALSAGKLDVYITAPGADLSAASPSLSFTTVSSVSSNLQTLTATTAGTPYQIRVTGYGNKADLRMDIPSITLTSQQIVTVALTPTKGGVLINGSTLVQQGAYAANRNTNARIRLASALAGAGVVTATAGSTAIDSSVSPNLGFYVLVPASSSLSVTTGSGSVQVANPTALTPGSDLTLLVYGGATTTATLIADDNTLPVDSTTAKVRMINGVTGSTGALTLTANNAPVGISVAPGAASTPVSLTLPTNSNTFNLTLSSSTAGTLLNTSTTFNANTVYTVLAGGDVSAPQLLIR